MAKVIEATARKVYVLPQHLVNRISAYQQEMGFESEVEAVRRLLDDALRLRDGWKPIVERFTKAMAGDERRLQFAAATVLIGHPLVRSTMVEKNTVNFSMITGEKITLGSLGFLAGEDADGQKLKYEAAE